jgi:DNA-binding winged helix-turn-helix (wHTH) protein
LEHIVYIFEGFRLDAGRRQLSSSGGVVVPLNSRAMEALLILVSRAGELVTKKQLLEGVWPSAVVEENNINQCVLAIRKALSEAAGSNRFIMTVTGRGYRFVAPVIAQTRESTELPAAVIPRYRWFRHWKIAAASAATAGFILALLATGVSRHSGPAGPADPGALVVHLRDGSTIATTGAAALQDCLQQRPDLHLEVEVRVVGGGSGPPLWTGKYLAGAQDLSADPAGDEVRVNAPQRDACQSLDLQ